ncbi:hypothetical protein [Comamonas sp. JC664]|uniref:hypothetical protein n=1 Tax=Comamonas sp. JC664 TaxID=2801917 RepID=UPI00174C107A|nr:hypothetical protein [Comamonas sp. JC664]MBL0695633.1 hypothetical protein [Comamonas sp. JC664]GHG62658.1 hypothetical protein GCM10012319_01500 [Comamonas sp. KCTC 72670]
MSHRNPSPAAFIRKFMGGFAAALACVAAPTTALAEGAEGKIPAELQSGFSLVECALGSQSQRYTPPINLASQEVYVSGTGQFSSCIDLMNQNINYGNFTVEGLGSASCVLASIPTRNVVTWNDGSQSVIEFVGGLDVKPLGQSVVTTLGRVSSGRYENALAIKTLILTNIPGIPQCLSSGVAFSSGPVSLTLLRLF